MNLQRVDIEKPRHRTIITSDVRQQIITMNRKAREEWDKKQGDSEKNPSVNEVSLFFVHFNGLMCLSWDVCRGDLYV